VHVSKRLGEVLGHEPWVALMVGYIAQQHPHQGFYRDRDSEHVSAHRAQTTICQLMAHPLCCSELAFALLV
jgi:hypothetical protein